MNEAQTWTGRLARSVKILACCVVLLLVLQAVSLCLLIRREFVTPGLASGDLARKFAEQLQEDIGMDLFRGDSPSLEDATRSLGEIQPKNERRRGEAEEPQRQMIGESGTAYE